MTQSANQQLVDNIVAVLRAGLPEGTAVDDARVEPYSDAECPAVRVVRYLCETPKRGADIYEATQRVAIEVHTRGADWLRAADALHVAAHELLMSSEVTNAPQRQLQAISTTPEADLGEVPAGRLVAIYETRVIVLRADLSVTIN